MKTQPFNFDGDMADIESWWAEHEQPVALREILSNRGRIVPGVCAAWLYLSDGPLAMIGWPVANPDASPREVHAGFELIFDEMLDEAKENGTKIVVAYTAKSGLIKMFKSAGFVVGDGATTSLFAGV